MGSLWNFFGLPDPEGSTPAAANTPPPAPAAPKPVSLTGTQTEEAAPQAETVSAPTAYLNPISVACAHLHWVGMDPSHPTARPFTTSAWNESIDRMFPTRPFATSPPM